LAHPYALPCVLFPWLHLYEGLSSDVGVPVEVDVVAEEEAAEIVVVVEVVAETADLLEIVAVEGVALGTVVEGAAPETVEAALETVVVVVAAEIVAVAEIAVADLLETVAVEEEEVVDIDPDSRREVHAVAHLSTLTHRTKSHLKTA